MTRPLRIEFEGALYHITARGNRQESIFYSDDDRDTFLYILGKVIARYNWICHGYCLMNNHYHLLIETPEGNLSAGMRQLNGVYTQKLNRTYDKVGHVFQGRFKSILVEKDSYLLELCRYIVLNPVRVGSCDKPEQWVWSSYRTTVFGKKAPDWLTVDWVLSQFSYKRVEARQKYREFVLDALNMSESPLKQVVGQLILGSQSFVESLNFQLTCKAEIKEFSRQQRLVGRPVLEELVTDKQDKTLRNKAVKIAHFDYGYSLKEIADHIGRHYSTVSRIISG
ncbi:MAG: addiction module toxin RelE [Desulfuromonadales bacterium C00003068]|jgi:REP element-mobilizing transposase RayT|nr:MAG: addiction module toxin RelE [Desulfuromonadales bacterium C00003068]